MTWRSVVFLNCVSPGCWHWPFKRLSKLNQEEKSKNRVVCLVGPRTKSLRESIEKSKRKQSYYYLIYLRMLWSNLHPHPPSGRLLIANKLTFTTILGGKYVWVKPWQNCKTGLKQVSWLCHWFLLGCYIASLMQKSAFLYLRYTKDSYKIVHLSPI